MFYLLFVTYGAITNRLRGYGGHLPQSLCRLSVCVLPWLAVTLSVDWKTGLCVGAFSYLGIITGHGRYFTLGRGPYPPRSDNWPGKLVGLFVKDRYTAKFDALALGLTGLAFVVPSAIAFALYGHIFGVFATILAGVLKPAAYELGWRIYKPGTDPNAFNEIAYGAVLGLAYSLAISFN